MADNHFDLVLVWDNLGGSVRVNGGGKAAVTDPSTGAAVTVVQGGASVTTVTADSNGRVSFVAQQGTVKLTSGGLTATYISAEQATAGAANAAAAQSAQVAAEAARDDAVSTVSSRVSKGELVINPANYGAALDGTTNDTTALQNAINAAAAAGSFGAVGVVSWTGRAKVTGITLPSGVVLRGHGPSTVLVQSGAPANLISATGSLGTSLALTADATAGTQTLTLASTSGFAVGDIVILTDAVSYAVSDSTYKSGESLTVTALTATTLTVDVPVRGSFGTSDGTYLVSNGSAVRRMTPVTSVGIESLSIEGDKASTTTLFLAQYARAPYVRDVHIRQGGAIGLRFDSCVNATVTGGSIRDLVDDIANNHAGYAVCASGATDGLAVTGVAMSRIRHGFTTMGGADGIPRRISVTGCTISAATTAALDTHAAGDDILFASNVIIGGGNGISIRSRNAYVHGNLIRLTTSHGIYVAETVAKDVTIDGNTVRNTGSGAHGITTVAVDGLVITRNYVDRVGADGIRIDVASKRVKILDNTVTNVGMSLTGRSGISPTGTSPQSGWHVARNLVGQDAGVGSAATAISGGAGLTGSYFYDNRAFGTFTSSVFNTGSNTSRRNEQIDVALPTNPDTSGATLTALETEVNELKARLRTVGILG